MVRNNLYKSQSGIVHILGNGLVGGKGEGTLYLDQKHFEACDISGHLEQNIKLRVPNSLIVCDDFFGLPVFSFNERDGVKRLPHNKFDELVFTIKDIGLRAELALRSSSPIEDGKKIAAAGVFNTDFFIRSLDTRSGRKRFLEKLLQVINSAYTPLAAAYWEKAGYEQAPPIPIIIQDAVGKGWKNASRYFMPIVSGVINTSPCNYIKAVDVLGFGLAAVNETGIGKAGRVDVTEYTDEKRNVASYYYTKYDDYNRDNIFCIDNKTGKMINLKGNKASVLFSKHSLKRRGHASLFNLTRYSAELAAGYEKNIGMPVECEFASKELNELYMLQIRPAKRGYPIPRPIIDNQNIIFNTNNFFGRGQEQFDKIIWLNDPNELMLGMREHVKNMTDKHPGALFVYDSRIVSERTSAYLLSDILPFCKTLIVRDTKVHIGGSGLKHLGLNCDTEEKMIIVADGTQGARLHADIRGNIIDNYTRPNSVHSVDINVYKLPRPINVAADNYAEWAMVYF